MSMSGDMVYRLPDSYIVIDLETTGLDAKRDNIIELAAVRVENGEITEQYESLINPGYPVDEFITDLTGITNEMLESAPILEQKLYEYLAFIQRDILLGHYLCFDIRFLKAAAENIGIEFSRCQYTDTLHIARKIYPEWKHHRLCDLVENLQIQSEQSHRAMADVLATKHCYDVLRAAMRKRGMTEDDIKSTSVSCWRKTTTIKVEMQPDDYEPSEKFCFKQFVFTGEMEHMTRKEGMQKVLNAGGRCSEKVSRATRYLVIGNAGYRMAIDGGKSTKQQYAESLKLQGCDIDVISEDVFLQMLESED